jgi:hypothetical protein
MRQHLKFLEARAELLESLFAECLRDGYLDLEKTLAGARAWRATHLRIDRRSRVSREAFSAHFGNEECYFAELTGSRTR